LLSGDGGGDLLIFLEFVIVDKLCGGFLFVDLGLFVFKKLKKHLLK
jgi:hypothetical protein